MKVGYVIPYLDDADPAWAELYRKYSAFNGVKDPAENARRFAKNTLFKYQLRGVAKYMPWVDQVYLVVQSESQAPDWINRDEVRLILHEDFIPKQFLPTFNSNTIESFLPFLPLRSANFIYANDDTYVLNGASESYFFRDFMPVISMTCRTPPPYAVDDFHRLNFHVTSTVCAKLGVKYEPGTFLIPHHVQKAMSLPALKRVYAEFEHDILGSVTRFREPSNFSQALYTVYYALSTGAAFVDNSRPYFMGGSESTENLISVLRSENRPVLACFNNCNPGSETLVEPAFAALFPDRCKYER